jgi:hypothetical protein
VINRERQASGLRSGRRERRRDRAATGGGGSNGDVEAESAYACWPLQLLPVRRRKAVYALYAFCREVEDIADGEASRSLRQTLLLNIGCSAARLLAGRPQDNQRCNRCSPA